MYRFKNYIALFLLLLFIRVVAPESLLLAFHSHEHTEEASVPKHGKLNLDTKHQHCHVDQLFNAPFAPAQAVVLEAILIPFIDTYSASCAFAWKFTFPNNTELRGPPVA